MPDGAAAWANEFAPDRANDFERGCDPGELLGHVTEHLHLLTVVRATRFGLEHIILAREVCSQCLPRGCFVRRCIGGRSVCALSLHTLHVCNAASGGQILDLGLEGLDLPLQLFGLAAELHAPKFVDLRLKLLDLDIAFSKQTTGLDQQGLQQFDIVWRIGAVRHTP